MNEPRPRSIAGFNVNATERWLLMLNELTNEVEFVFCESFGEDAWFRQDSIGIPVAALREVGFRIASTSMLAPLALPRGRELIVVPRVAPDGATVIFTEGGTLVRAARFSVGGRKRLVSAIEQARAAARDPLLLGDLISRLEEVR